jgi:putative FmdB family regulatory protein
MPIYEYACQKCGRVTEVMQKVSDPPPKKCEHCGGKLHRVISQTSFQLKGGGWYKDLYSSSGASSAATKSEAKTEASPAKSDTKEAKPAAEKTEKKKTAGTNKKKA